MKFSPCNRYLLIERNQQPNKTESLIELPEGAFGTSSAIHERVKILAVSPGVRPPIAEGKDAIVLSHMIEQVDFGDETVYLVLENHILGLLSDTDGENNK
jgi:hypothetical protein